MNDGYERYKKMIDEFVKLSQSSTEATNVKKGSFPKVEMFQDINTLLEKLSEKERETLSKLLVDCRSAAIFDVLHHLEWLRCCHDMQISEDNIELILDKAQGFSDDFIGRLTSWQWPE